MGGIRRMLRSSRFWAAAGIAIPAALVGAWPVAGAVGIAYIAGTAAEDAAKKLRGD